MNILSMKPGHDGNIAYLSSGELQFSYEAEKDSFSRYSDLTPSVILKAFENVSSIPDIVALSGWVKGFHSIERPLETGYFGIDKQAIKVKKIKFLSKFIDFFSSTHERSHIMCGYGMSPFPQGNPCYVLVWEGTLGDFYEVDSKLNIKKIGQVLPEPGNKYAFLYSLADPDYRDSFQFSYAGKLMALAAFSDREKMSAEEKETADYIIEEVILSKTLKSEMSWSMYHNIGVENKKFKQLAGKFSDELFLRFYDFAKANCRKGYPLIVTGGCGLNCEWNTKWKDSKLFSDVFIPPVTNDTGCAIGTGIDANFYFTGNAKINWTPYLGEPFIDDLDLEIDGFKEIKPFNHISVAKLLMKDNIIAWVSGRCEIGPRALGNRSILASPFKSISHKRLNSIKQREGYRPIAPVCIEEDVSLYFDWNEPSPHMLFFQKVKDKKLKAITHIDGTARVQTVTESSNKNLYKLLKEFKNISDYGVLCNTSLNFKGRGFINRTSDLVEFVKLRKLDGFVINERLYIKI